jgi:hypothetical protein
MPVPSSVFYFLIADMIDFNIGRTLQGQTRRQGSGLQKMAAAN